MKKTANIILTVTIAAVILMTVVSSIFSYIAMTGEFDHDIGHFKVGSVSAGIAMYLPIAAAAVSLVGGLLIRKKITFDGIPDTNIPTVFTSVLAGLLLIASAVFTVIEATELSRITIGVIVTAVIGGLYLILLPFMHKKPFMIFLSFVPPVWAALKLLEEYFSDGGPINSPIRTINLTMLAFLLLFFAEEIRFRIDCQIPCTYYFLTLSALAFTGNAVFPKLAIILTGNTVFDFSFIDCAVGVAMFMFLLARLSALPSVTEEPSKATKTESESK